MGRPKEHDERIGARLLDAAERLLRDSGPDALSVRAVANEVETTTRAVYSVFGSKSGLLEGVAARGYGLLAEHVRAVPDTDDPGADLVAVGIDAFRRFALEHPELYRITFERVPASLIQTEVVGTAAMDSYDALLHKIRRAQSAGAITEPDEVRVAFAFHALCAGLATGELSSQPPPVGASFWGVANHLDLEEVWRRALEALITGL